MTESQKQRGFIDAINLERLEAIRQIEEEIEFIRHLVNHCMHNSEPKTYPAARIMFRLEAWRDEMKRGMRV